MEQNDMDAAREEDFGKESFSDTLEIEDGFPEEKREEQPRGGAGAQNGPECGADRIQVTLDGQPVSLSLREAEQLIGRGKAWKALKQENDRLKKCAYEMSAARDGKRREIENFVSAYPEVTPEEIPMEVWRDVRGGMALETAYLKNRVRTLEAQNAQLRQYGENRQKTTGSVQSAGENTRTDPFLDGWED